MKRINFTAMPNGSGARLLPRMVSAALACVALTASLFLLPGCDSADLPSQVESDTAPAQTTDQTLESVPAYDGYASVEVNNNDPVFTDEQVVQAQSAIESAREGDVNPVQELESYSPLDAEGRCGTAYALVGEEVMPTEERGSISKVHPTGWQSVRYDFVEGESLYNRSHLIGWALAGENANDKNLITGTRYMNTSGMNYYEELVGDYVYETGNHVLYRVTPVFSGDDLVARGVQMEGRSIEDDGAGVSFNVYCYNVQPGVGIDYGTGDNWEDGGAPLERAMGGDENGSFPHEPAVSQDVAAAGNGPLDQAREEVADEGHS